MNKVILFVSFICIISQISSISSPKFPVTFYTSVKVVERFANITQHPITGIIANDDAKQLYVMNEKVSPNIPVKVLFNNICMNIRVIQLTVNASMYLQGFVSSILQSL